MVRVLINAKWTISHQLLFFEVFGYSFGTCARHFHPYLSEDGTGAEQQDAIEQNMKGVQEERCGHTQYNNQHIKARGMM